MAPRLSLKLGVVADRDRTPDSPDAVIVVEPTIGSIARSKGSLYLLVTSTVAGSRARDATRQAAESMRDEYYYDESAGIRVCLEKVLTQANKRLAHHDRLGSGPNGGPIGVAVAVIRGAELYVATVGPAEAYLIRSARLSTLPDPHRDRGLPTAELTPDIWRGEINVGDSLVLVSPNVVGRLGPDELKDLLVTLHPQPAMEQLHQRFIAAGGKGSDGVIAIEATEVSAIEKPRALIPVRPDEPLAGLPDHSPIPLADSVTDGVAAVSAGARQARVAAGGWAGRMVRGVQDRLPHRSPPMTRVTPFATRQETRRRAAVALLAFVVVAAGLGFAVWVAAGNAPHQSVASLTAGQRALQTARDDIATVWAPGVDLVTGDPGRAKDLLEDAYRQLDAAETSGVPTSTTTPLKTRVATGLDTLYGVVEVTPQILFGFPTSDPPVDLTALVRGPDGKAFVIDGGSKAVLRIDAKAGEATAILRAGDKIGGITVGEPKLLSVGGNDLLVLDTTDQLWRWTPADKNGRGTVRQVRVKDSASWGDDILAIGTFCRADCSLYNLYVVDPSSRQILTYSPAADGSGYPDDPTGRLATARDVSGFTDLYIDGDIWAADGGTIERFVGGRDDGWRAAGPGDTLLRSAPSYTLIGSGDAKRTGVIYGYDRPNARFVAIDKTDGSYVEQYRVTGRGGAWSDVRGVVYTAGIEDGPASVTWIDHDQLMTAVLEANLGASPSASPSAGPSGSAAPSASGSVKASPSAKP